MHSFGMAIDISIDGLSPQEILDEVKKNRAKFSEITAYEAISFTKTWNHFDCRVTNQLELFEVSPS